MMNSAPQENIALVTVTSDDFILGTLVMLASFTATNDWFKGEIVIVQDELSEESIKLIRLNFPKVVFHSVSKRLKSKLMELEDAIPELKKQLLQFASLEMLAMNQYQKVIFCDSDLFFQGSIEALLHHSDPLLCCGDGAYLRGNVRSAIDFTEIISNDADKDSYLVNTFNSGFMVVDASLLTERNFTGIVAMITPERWQHNPTGHTDQMLLNFYFSGQQTIVSSTYNYALLHQRDLQSSTDISLNDAKVIHFNGPTKPWLLIETIRRTVTEPAIATAFLRWNETFVTLVARQHLLAMTKL